MIHEKTKIKIAPPKQTKEKQGIAAEVLDRIEELKFIRKQKYDIVRERTMQEYWDDSVKRFIQYKQRPQYKEGWQANTASSTPADKLIGILSKLAGQAMETQIISDETVTLVGLLKERVLGSFLKAAAKKNDDDRQLIFEMMGAMSKGTIVGFEGWRYGTAQIRDIVNQDPETGKIEVKERKIRKWNDVWSEITPIENFYPGNIYIRPGVIQDMADCAMRKIMKEDEFFSEFENYPDADIVLSRSRLSEFNEDGLFYKLPEDLSEDEIEIWYYFNKERDEFVMIANGIWINPFRSHDIMPLLWNHKKLPFWAGVFEPFAEDFFYGRSLPDKLITLSDMSDAMFDRILDQLALSVHKPLVTRKRPTSLTRGFLHPGQVIEVKGSGDIRGEFSEVNIGEPSPVHLKVLEILENRLDRTAFSSDISTTTPKTATQVLRETQVAVELASLFLKFMEFAMRDKNRLRLANIIQFYTLPIHGKDDEKKFKKITLHNEKLSNGKIGVRQVEITDQDIVKEQMNLEQEIMQSPHETEILRVSPEFIRNFEGDITIIPTTSIKQTEAVRQALELNFQQVIANLYPDKLNRDSGFEDLLRVFNKDMRRLKAQTRQEEQDMFMPQRGTQETPEVFSKILTGIGGSLRQTNV